jgi:NAD(P)-dependent dehydrogenase (short-subunit alcohol dehydrogenase family)
LEKFYLDDRVAVVTGGGRGMGAGIATGFAEAGAHVVVAEIEPQKGEETVEKIRSLGRKALALRINVLDRSQVMAMVEKALAEFGRIDILVNNVGGTYATKGSLITEFDDEKWERIIEVNLKSTFLCTKNVSPVMVRQKSGNIINIVSAAGLRPHPVQLPYATVKAGIVNFTQSVAVQLAQFNIRVNAIAPGKIVTPGTDYLSYLGDSHARARLEGTPLGKAGQTEDVAAAAVYLASDASAYVTGHCIPVMGGPYMGAMMMKYAEERWMEKKPL